MASLFVYIYFPNKFWEIHVANKLGNYRGVNFNCTVSDYYKNHRNEPATRHDRIYNSM